ncbi:Alanine dehydrogenase [Dirofilaria immitis]
MVTFTGKSSGKDFIIITFQRRFGYDKALSTLHHIYLGLNVRKIKYTQDKIMPSMSLSYRERQAKMIY